MYLYEQTFDQILRLWNDGTLGRGEAGSLMAEALRREGQAKLPQVPEILREHVERQLNTDPKVLIVMGSYCGVWPRA